MKKILLVCAGVVLGILGSNLATVKEAQAADVARPFPVAWPIDMACQVRFRDNVRNGPPTEMNNVRFKGLNGDWIVVRSSPAGTTWYPKDVVLSVTFPGANKPLEK